MFGLFMMTAARGAESNFPGFISGEFIYEKAPFPECHASTIVEAAVPGQKPGQLVAAWFGGTKEKNKDVGIWVARREGDKWTAPVEVANGIESATVRYPSWNPVLFQPTSGPLLLFYKVGPDPDAWWGMLITSTDAGKTWSKPQKLPPGIYGPIKNKPVQLADGAILCPTSTEDKGWLVHFERGALVDGQWQATATKPLAGKPFGAIQPAILFHPKNRLQALCRSEQGKIVETWSDDGGKTWSDLAATTLPNPNSGIDAVTLRDGKQLLIYNHVDPGRIPSGWGSRSPLNLAISSDGKKWEGVGVLESERGEFSYPAIIQTSDGLVHLTYTWQRKKVRHAVVDPAKLVVGR